MDYRGSCGVIIYNSTPFLNQVDKGERIAQFVPAYVAERPEITSSEDVSSTERGSFGFGSTGSK